MDIDLSVGTVGMSVWFSKDLGENWKRASSSAGLNAECRVWTLADSPATPRYLYAGGDEGVHRWDETEQRWTHLRSPLDGRPVWAIAQSPHDARMVLAGCRPTALYRSDDAGDGRREARVDSGRVIRSREGRGSLRMRSGRAAPRCAFETGDHLKQGIRGR